jgi:hypothetical protein
VEAHKPAQCYMHVCQLGWHGEACVAKRRKGETKVGGGKEAGNREAHAGNRATQQHRPRQNTAEAAKATQEHKLLWHGDSRSRYVKGYMHALWPSAWATPGILSIWVRVVRGGCVYCFCLLLLGSAMGTLPLPGANTYKPFLH